jgi:hypothetical protein
MMMSMPVKGVPVHSGILLHKNLKIGGNQFSGGRAGARWTNGYVLMTFGRRS